MTSILKVSEIQDPTNSNTALTIDANGNVNIPGHVLQVVEGSSTSYDSTSTDAYTSSGLSASITPSSTSSKILVFANVIGQTDVSDGRLSTTIYRDSTNLGSGSLSGIGYLHAPSGRHLGMVPMSILDTPNSTSSITYTVYFKSGAGVGIVNIRSDVNVGKITLMEIAG